MLFISLFFISFSFASSEKSQIAKNNSLLIFALIGDYGENGNREEKVRDLVYSWDPEFIVTLGDNSYPTGEKKYLIANVLNYYGKYIGGVGRPKMDNQFFPCPGNHDYKGGQGLTPYLQIFESILPKGPGKGRYYDFKRGQMHFFSLDSNPETPDDISINSRQGKWLKRELLDSKATFKIVYMHHPPYSSRVESNSKEMRWPYKEWGANLVLAGHGHFYERLEKKGLTYMVNGLGGNHERQKFTKIDEESIIRFNDDFGAIKAQANQNQLILHFITQNQKVIDKIILNKE